MAFYRELAADPTKAFWQANGTNPGTTPASGRRWTRWWRPWAEDGAPKVFRPYQDVRFAKGASPYKDHQGAFVQVADGIGWYVQIDAKRTELVSGGYHAHASDQTARFRAAVDADRTGRELEDMVKDMEQADFAIWGRVLKTRPRGVPADHPRLGLMRHQNITGWREPVDDDWVFTGVVVDRIGAQSEIPAPARGLARHERRPDRGASSARPTVRPYARLDPDSQPSRSKGSTPKSRSPTLQVPVAVSFRK